MAAMRETHALAVDSFSEEKTQLEAETA